MGARVDAGTVKLLDETADGLEHAPAAFIGMPQARSFGKLVVRVGLKDA